MKKRAFVISCCLLLSSSVCMAFNLPGLGGLGGGQKKESAGDGGVSVDKLVSQQTGLMGAMKGSLTELLGAQSLLFGAIGEKGKAQQLKETSDGLASGTLTGDKLTTAMAASKSATAEFKAKAADAKLADAESKATYAKGVAQYVKGVVSTRKIVAEAQSFGSNASSALQASPMSVGTKLNDGISVAKEVPGLAGTFGTTTKMLFTYGQDNGVDLSKAKKDADLADS